MLSQNQIRNLPVIVEFVSVPSTFDIELYLTMRETAGIFDGKETYLDHVKFISETVKSTPYFVLAKCPEVTVQSAFLCLELFRQIGLTLDSNYSEAWDSKFRGRTWENQTRWDFMDNEDEHDEIIQSPMYEAGHISQQAYVMVIVNVYKVVEDGHIKKIIEKVVEVEDRVAEAEEAQEMLSKK